MTCSDRIAYQTYNDVQSINARRRDQWTVIAESTSALKTCPEREKGPDEPDLSRGGSAHRAS